MKRYFEFFAFVLLSGCVQSSQSNSNESLPQEAVRPPIELVKLFTRADAEKILGEPAHLSDSSATQSPDVVMIQCGYQANAEDSSTRKTGTVYFLVEQYTQVSAAEKKYNFIKTANANHGIQTLDGIGDEAYFHTDKMNFYFIMVRKGSGVFNIKVNKITRHASRDAFNAVAKSIASSL